MDGVTGLEVLASIGAGLFGVIVGWITYRTLARRTEAVQLSDIATVIGAVGGAAVTGLFDSEYLFAWYCIGMAVGFFGWLIMYARMNPGKLGVIMGATEPNPIDDSVI